MLYGVIVMGFCSVIASFLLNSIVTDVLGLAKKHQTGRVTEKVTNVTFILRWITLLYKAAYISFSFLVPLILRVTKNSSKKCINTQN